MRIAPKLSTLAFALALLYGSDAWAQTAPSDNPGPANSQTPSAFSQVAAQSARRRPASDGPEFGAKLGLVRPSDSYAGGTTRSSPHGWEGGLFISSNRVERLGFMSELLLKKRGFGTDNFADGRYSIQLPVLLRANVPVSDGDGPVVFAAGGPAAEVLLFDRARGEFDFDYSGIHRIDFALAGSIGIEVSRFTFEARLDRGLKNRIDCSEATCVGNPVVKSRSFSLLGGFRFN